MDKPFSFGAWLRRQRLAHDWRQDGLAARLGIATVTLRKLEADERRPSLQLIARLAAVLGLGDDEAEALRRVARADLSRAALPLPAQPTLSAPVPAPRHNLPAPPNPLIGREAELAELASLLSQPAPAHPQRPRRLRQDPPGPAGRP
ncbi:MAG: hypothetical protein OHK0015_44720 [Chloroflexi bacterium OHK40]